MVSIDTLEGFSFLYKTAEQTFLPLSLRMRQIDIKKNLEKSLRNGERSKVGICEAMLCGAPLQCWDNSTRGLDSESVMNFLRYLRDQTRLTKSTACIALYQASQEAYDVSATEIQVVATQMLISKMFEKVTILYEGRQIYFGPCHEAKSYFTNLGFIEKTKSQTTAEFLTSLTNADLRVTK